MVFIVNFLNVSMPSMVSKSQVKYKVKPFNDYYLLLLDHFSFINFSYIYHPCITVPLPDKIISNAFQLADDFCQKCFPFYLKIVPSI